MRSFHIFILIFLGSACGDSSGNHEVFRTHDNQDRSIVLYDDKTWDYVENTASIQSLFSSESSAESQPNPISSSSTSRLRSDILVSTDLVSVATEMMSQGWKYHMPEPKSDDANWTVTDGRTTWYNGYWENQLRSSYSTTTPIKESDGSFIGNGKRPKDWRTGGRPKVPTKLEYLLSESGGVKPR